MYVTPAQLADRPGATELAEVATPERQPVVDAALMDATLRDTDRSSWSADDVAVADATLACITQASSDADGMIDGYLARRYTLPLANVPGVVKVWATAMTRYLLHKNRRSMENDDPIVRDYRDANRFLQLTADGKFSLGAADPTPSGGAPEVCAPERVFTQDTLQDFGA